MLDAVELLKTAVSIPSVSGGEAEVARHLVRRMAAFADEAFMDEAGNAVARLGRGERHVLCLGHIDTVPGDIPVRVEDGILHGRGAVDAKGSFCAAVAAASRLSQEALAALRLTLVGAVEEEAPSSKGARHALAAYGKPDFVIIGEPSGWDGLTLGYKGRLVLCLRLQKDNFHSAGADATAAEDLVGCWLAVREWADAYGEGREGVFDRVQVALQDISSGGDGLRQSARACFGLRLPPGLPPRQAEAALREVLSQGPGPVLDFSGHVPAYRGPRDTALSRAFRLAIREAGGTPRFKLKTGTSDMNIVAPVWDVPVLAYGPGDSALDHRPDERLSLTEYERAIGVLHQALEALATKG